MKRISTALFAAAVAFAGVSCKSTDSSVSANPYEDNPYYGPQSTGSTTASSDYASVTPAAPAQNYTAPAPAPAAPAYTPPAAPAYSPPVAPATNYGGATSHVVSKGDTLYNLSRRYGTSVAAIQAANGLNDSLIILGSTLNIPRG
jgi:LysM repeat protein